MNYRQEIFYQEARGKPHRLVTEEELQNLVGWYTTECALLKAKVRAESKDLTPEIAAFFRGDLMSCVIVHEMTSRGDVFIQLTVTD